VLYDQLQAATGTATVLHDMLVCDCPNKHEAGRGMSIHCPTPRNLQRGQVSKRHHRQSSEPLPEVDWKSFKEAGALSPAEYLLVKQVERDPESCTTPLLQQYLLLRAKHGLLPGAKAPERPRASAGEPSSTEAFDAYMKAAQGTQHTLKIRLLLLILMPESKYFGKDYRREWNKMAGFELFDLSKENKVQKKAVDPLVPEGGPLVDEDEKELDRKDDEDADEKDEEE